jgi:hypothetical protein
LYFGHIRTKVALSNWSSGNHGMRVSDTLASVLRSGRGQFNARFVEARRVHPALDGQALAEFLRSTVDPLAQAVARARPECVSEVVVSAYDVALDLVGQRLVGPGARHGLIEDAWRRIFPHVAPLVAASPTRVMAAMTNAIVQLASTPGARADQWIADLERLADECGDVETLLRVGQVAAWRAGMTHFRQGALVAAAELPQSLTLAALGAPASAAWQEIQSRLAVDPWFDPSQPQGSVPAGTSGLRVAARAGAFRGFGGLFTEPPRVAASGENFLVQSGQECWLLSADVFGATFHRAPLEDFQAASSNRSLPAGLDVSKGRIVWKGHRHRIPTLAEFTSAAANATTLALTSPLTHAVVLVALS